MSREEIAREDRHALRNDIQRLAARHQGVRIGVHHRGWLPTGVTVLHAMLTAVMLVWVRTMWADADPFTASTITWPFAYIWPYTPRRWGFVFLAASLVGVAGVLIPTTRRQWRLHLAGCLALCHFGLAVVTYAANPASPAWLIYMIFLCASIWRIAAEAFVEWHQL